MVPETIEVGGTDESINTDDEPVPKAIARTVGEAMRSHGYNVDLIDLCSVAQHSEIARDGRDLGRTPLFMTDETDTSDLIRSGVAFPFSVEKALDGYFGQSEGSSNVTTFYVRDRLALPTVVEHFHNTGQIQLAAEKVKPYINSQTDALDVVAYAIATYAKGWFAERLLAETERFSKGSVAQDKGGLDLYDTEAGGWIQLKSVTVDSQLTDHVYYQWDCEGRLHYGTQYIDVAGAAADAAGMPKVATRRCHNNNRDENGNTYRYIWW